MGPAESRPHDLTNERPGNVSTREIEEHGLLAGPTNQAAKLNLLGL